MQKRGKISVLLIGTYPAPAAEVPSHPIFCPLIGGRGLTVLNWLLLDDVRRRMDGIRGEERSERRGREREEELVMGRADVLCKMHAKIMYMVRTSQNTASGENRAPL